MTAATAQEVQYLNLAYFGRPADPASLSAWPASGLSLEEIVLKFTETAEYAANTVEPNSVVNVNGGRTFNDTNLINTFYQRLFGRLATTQEVAGWSDALAQGAVNYDYLGITILQAALNLPPDTEMRQVLIAKFDSNELYTGILYNNPDDAAAYSNEAAIQNGIAFSASTTTTTPATFAQAQAAVNQMVIDSGSETYTLTTALEAFDAGTLAAFYSIEPGTQAQGGVLTVIEGVLRRADVQSLIDGATNSLQLNVDNFNFSLNDLWANLIDPTGTALIPTSDSYRLADAAGSNLGGLNPDQVAILNGATNGTEYVYTPLDPGNQEIIELTRTQFTYEGSDFAATTFIGQLTDFGGQQTLLNQDRINGGAGDNTLIATLAQSVTPASLRNVQNVEITNAAAGPVVLNLQNADDIELLTNNGSASELRVRNLDVGANLEMLFTDSNFRVDFLGATGGADATSIRLEGVGVGAAPSLVLNGGDGAIETVSIESLGIDPNVIGGGATLDGVTTLNVAGDADFTVFSALADVTTADANGFFGDLTLTFTEGAVTATGGFGDDTFFVNGVVGDANLAGGFGNNQFVFAAGAFDGNDSVNGGFDGNDLLVVDGADAAIDYANVSAVETLTVQGAAFAAGGTATLSEDFDTVNLTTGTAGDANLLGGGAGSLTVNVGGVLGGAFTVADAGAATDDVLNLNNANAGAVDTFAGQSLAVNGYETVDLFTGAATAAQNTGTITVTPDGVGTGVLNISGFNSLLANGAIDATTIDASGMGGTAFLQMSGVTQNATLITGSANADTLIASALGTQIDAGDGADTVLGAAANDTINAGDGADSIDAAAGADIVNLAEAAAASDSVVQGGLDSVVATSSTGVGNIVAGYTLTYGNGVDVVNGFTAGVGGDVLQNLIGAGAPTAALGGVTNGIARGLYFLSGNYNTATDVFTVAANGAGADTLIFQVTGTQTDIATNASVVILRGVDSDNLDGTNFALDPNALTITGTYNATPNDFTIVSAQSGIFAPINGTVNIAADGTITTSDPDAAVVQPVAYSQLAVDNIDASDLIASGLVTINIGTEITSAALRRVVGADADNNFVFADETVLTNGGNNVQVIGDAVGIDTVTLTNVAATDVLGVLGETTFTNIENLSLTNGTGAFTLTLDNRLGGIAVTNASADQNSTVILSTDSDSSYFSASTGVDTVTVNQVDQDASTGGGDDLIILNTAGTYSGTYNLGTGAADVLQLGGAGTYNLENATLTNVVTLDADAAQAYVLQINTTNFAAITNFDFNGGGNNSDTLALNNGDYDFSAKTLLFDAGAGANTIDLNSLGSGGKTLTLDATDVANVATFTGEVVGTAVTRLNFNDSTNISTAATTNIDTVTIAGANQTLTLAGGGDFSATNFTTVTGSGTSNLAVGTNAALDLTRTTISGFDAINFTGVGNFNITLDAASISNDASVVITGDATTDFVVNQNLTATNWTLTDGDFDTVTLADGVSLTVTENFLSSSLVNVSGNGGAGIETFNVEVSALDSNIDLSGIVTAANLVGGINVTDGTGDNDIVTSGTDAVRAITNVSLANGGSDLVVILNTDDVTNGVEAAVNITGFDIANDQIATSTGAGVGLTPTSNGVFFSDWWNTAEGNLATGTVVEVDANDLTSNGADSGAVLAAINALLNPLVGAAGAEITAIVYTGAGQAGIYQLEENAGGAGSTFDVIELVGFVNAADNSLLATNFV